MPESDAAGRLFDDGFTGGIDPFEVFAAWFAEAGAGEVNDPNAMALATVDADGRPDVRMVLMNARDARGIVFFTNLDSAKSTQLTANPEAALLFHWKSIRRQVRIRGPVEPVTDAEADAYFALRPRQSRLGAHASAQSRPLDSRSALLARVEEFDARFAGVEVPRPARWSGYRVVPWEFEFWKDGAARLHDRMLFRRQDDGAWSRQRLNP